MKKAKKKKKIKKAKAKVKVKAKVKPKVKLKIKPKKVKQVKQIKKLKVRKIKKLKVKKPKKVKEIRVGSGVEGFDVLIQGGFEQQSINMVVGDSGSGKTILALQFLIEGLRKGEKCLYITFEEKKKAFYANMLDFGWNLEDWEKKNRFFFLEYSPEKVKTMIEEGGGEIETIVIKHKISRLVIDSFTSFALLFEDELERRQSALALFDIMRRWNCTSILTLQENPRERTESSSLEFEADGIILLYFVREKKTRKRFIEVLKMRGTKHSREVHPVEMTESGLKVSREVYVDHLFK